jgi:hypothetical protein
VSGLDVVAGVPRAVPATLQAAFGIPLVPVAAQQCISCHTTAAMVNGRLQVESTIHGVSCEACHGPGARHTAAMKAAGANPARHVATLIFNPASLAPADAEDFCGACHRTSVRVQAKGLHGLETVHYEPYRLELSSCWIMSQRITCLTCHNPHQPLARGSSAYDTACAGCHSAASLQSTAAGSAAHSGKVCPVGRHDCATCHMPKCRIPLSPFSMSDHFIRVVSADDACGQAAKGPRSD